MFASFAPSSSSHRPRFHPFSLGLLDGSPIGRSRVSVPSGRNRQATPAGLPTRVLPSTPHLMSVSFLLSIPHTPRIRLLSWLVMDLVFLSLLWALPHMVHNLLSIRQFTTDNYCSVNFDPSGLTVKDLVSRRPLLQCDSTGPL
jgi:hypothetical protein